jgi:hypothetical protein
MSGRMDVPALSVLLRPSPAIVFTMIALVAWAGYLTVTAPDDLRGPYIVLMLCQAFAASTGYATRARRGHFDQLLAGRRARARFALTHLSISTLVGAAAWLVVCVVDAIGGGGHWPLGLTPSALVSFVYLSSLAWALSVPFSRYSAGVLWLIVAIALAGSGRLLTLRNSYALAPHTWSGVWQAAGPALVFPPLVVGEPSGPPNTVIALLLVAAGIAVAGGVTFIFVYSLALEDAE